MPDVLVADARPYVQYACDGVQTVFTYPFPILAAEDLTVVLDDGTTPAGVSVDGVGADAGGTVTLSPAPAAGRTLTLFRDMPVARTSDFLEAGAFRASAINAELDRLTMMLQQVETLTGQAVKRAPEDADAALVLPPAAVRAGGVLAFDAQGQPDSSEAPSAAAARAIVAADAAETSATAAQARADAADQAQLAASARASDAQNHAATAQTSAQLADDRATSAQASATSASTAETGARTWADTAEDVEVAPGLYSARHWAAKAAQVDMVAERRRGDLMAVRARQAGQLPAVEVMPIFALDFQLGAGLDQLAVARQGPATVTGPAGALAAAPADTARIDHDPVTGAPLGLLIEGPATNLLHDSFNPLQQTHTLVAGTYTLSMRGSGSCALSGAASGTASHGVPLTFTLAADGAVTFTPTGGPTAVQCEAGGIASSPIETPADDLASRQDEIVTLLDTSWLTGAAFSLIIQASLPHVPANESLRLFGLNDGTANSRHEVMFSSADHRVSFLTRVNDTWLQLNGYLSGAWTPGAVHRIGLTMGGGQRALFIDGAKAGADSISEPAGLTQVLVGRDYYHRSWQGHIRALSIYPRALSDADLGALTA